jgi:hypothetical protein
MHPHRMSHVGPWLAAPLAALALAVAPLCRGRRALEPELVAATPRLSPRARCGARARAGARGLRYGSLPCGAQRRGTPEYARRKRQKNAVARAVWRGVRVWARRTARPV